MKRFCCSVFFCFLFSCFLFQNANSSIKGSESILSLEPYYTFLSTETDNEMLGFGWFKNGFALEDASTSCTFDSVFPVSGNVYLNGGYLHLGSDLLFRNMTTWHTPGTVFANDYIVDLSSSITALGNSSCEQVFEDVNLDINSDLIISGSVRLTGNCLINGNGKRILLADNGYLLIDVNATVTFKDIYIDGITEGKICCLGDSSKIILDDIRWIQDGNYSFTQGSIRFFNQVDFAGSHTFFYQSSQTSTIDTHSFWSLSQDIKVSIGRKEATNYIEPLYFADTTAVLKTENCCLSITESGMRMTHGLFILDRGVEIEINSTNSTNGLIFGDGTESEDMEFRFHPGARVLFSKGHLVYENTNPRSLRSRSGEAVFIRNAQSVFYLNTDVQLEGIALDTHPSSHLYIADGKTLFYDGCRILYPGVEYELGGGRYNDYTNLMNGNSDIFLIRGTLSPYTYVQNANNILHGNGDLTGKIILQDSDAALTLNIQGFLANDIELNGGSIAIEHNTKFTQDAMLTGSGLINISEYTMEFGADDLSFTDTLLLSGSGGTIRLNSHVELSSTWTIHGSCEIDGGGKVLTLAPGGTIIVDADSSLQFKNVRLEGIHANNIRCLSGNSTVTLDAVHWIQDDSFSFTQGRFCVRDKTAFSGNYTFSYESSQTSTIQNNSLWKLSDEITLYINRNNNVDPLFFEDETSVLKFDNATLKTGADGFEIKRGTLHCCHNVYLDITQSDSTKGLILGNSNAADDVKVIFLSGASVHFLSGALVYNITEPNRLVTSGSNAQLCRYAGSIFYVNEDIVLSNISIIDNDFYAAMNVADGKNTLYDNATIHLPGVQFDVTGYRYDVYTTLLNGNQELFLSKGVLPAYLLSCNTGNIIQGSGSLSGQIILNDSSADITFKLNGPLINDVVLNGGTIILEGDLEISQENMFLGEGKVNLGEYSIYLGSQDKIWTGSCFWEGNTGRLHLNSRVSLSGTWTFSGNCILDGHDNVLDLGETGKIFVEPDSSLTLRNIRIEDISDNKIVCSNDSSTLILENAKWMQNADYKFEVGKIEFKRNVVFSGDYTFSYDSAATSTIQNNSAWRIDDGMIIRIGRKSGIDGLDPLAFADNTALLELDNSCLHVTSSGMRLKRGSLLIGREVEFDIDGSTSVDGLIFGDGTVENDLTVGFRAGSTANFTTGALVYELTNPEGLWVRHGFARLVRGAQSLFYLNQDTTLKNLKIEDGSTAMAVIVKDGKTLNYDTCIIKLVGGVSFDITAQRYNFYTNLLNGDKEIFISKGTLPSYTLVMGTGNQIRGNGSVTGGVIVQGPSAELTFNLHGILGNDITLSNGKIILEDDLELAHDSIIAGAGEVDLGSSNLVLGIKNTSWSGDIYWDGNGGQIDQRSMITLSGTWTFSGNCVIEGQWNVLVLGDDAQIVVEKGSTLTFKEAKIKNLSANKIRCLDEHSTVHFYNSKTRLDADFTFTQGKMKISELFEVHDSYTFDYQSAQQATVGLCSEWKFLEGSTFKYNPSSNARDLICLQVDKGSKLVFDESSLHSTATGIQLTNGALDFYGDCYLKSDATVKAEGITFGDGNSANDLDVNVMPNAHVKLLSGYIVDKNAG